MQDDLLTLLQGLMTLNVNTLAKKKPALLPEFDGLRQELSNKIGSNVSVSCAKNGSGKVTFSFKNADDLRRIVAMMNV